MLITRLHRAQTQLQAHQTWLRGFVASQSAGSGGFQGTRTIQRGFATPSTVHEPVKIRKTKKTSARKTPRPSSERRPGPKLEQLSHRANLLKAIHDEDLKTAMALYAALPEKKPLNAEDVRALAQLTSQTLRTAQFNKQAPGSRDEITQIVAYAAQLAKDIGKERLMPSTHAHVHLLAVFKESGSRDTGIEFFRWLEGQDETYTSLEVYAVAIELLAINGSPLQELEVLYQDALARFPGTFSAYHISPDAVLPDRDQPINIPGLPSHLLKAIAFARLLRGDSRNAYLALDVQFRLFPTSVGPVFIQPFLRERPITEVYTIWAMACRAGIHLRPSDFKSFLAKIRTSSDLSSVASHIAVLRIMVATMYLHLGSTGFLAQNSVNELIIATTQVFRLDGMANLDTSQRKRVIGSVLETIRKVMEIFARYGALPTTTAFNAIISNLAGHGRAKDVIGVALADMDTLKLKPNIVTARSILDAAGRLKDASLIIETWQAMISEYDIAGPLPDVVAWRTLIKSAKMADCTSFAQDELDKLKGRDPLDESTTKRYLQNVLDREMVEEESIENSSSFDATELLHGIEKLKADLNFVEEQTRDQPAVQDFRNQSFPMTLVQSGDSLALPEHEMRKLYDELTTEPTSQSTASPSESNGKGSSASDLLDTLPKTSATNIPLGTLRYENWKCMNYLLWLAEQHDRKYEELVDKAIVAGERPPPRETSLTKEELENTTAIGLSDGAVQNSVEDTTTDAHVQKVRDEILRLKGKA